MTNRERLNKMSNKAFAGFLYKCGAGCELCVYQYDRGDCANNSCVLGIRYWLESEVES